MVALAFWPGQLGKGPVLAAGAGSAILALAAAWLGPFRRRGRILLALLPLAPLAAAGGWGGWCLRKFHERVPSLWDSIDFERPELGAVRAARQTGDFATARKALFEHFRVRPARDVRTLPTISPAEAAEVGDQVLGSTFKLLEFPPVKLPADLSWDEDPLKDRTWQWALHRMPFVAALTERYKSSGESRYLGRAEGLIRDWVNDNHRYFRQPPSRYAWHDHVTALRVRDWLPFWEAWTRSPLCEDSRGEKILQAIVAHAERLADPRFYTKAHNHGMEQDIALLAIACTFPELRKSLEWSRLAASRLKNQVEAIVSPDGVQLEHSAEYQVFTMGILMQARDFAFRNALSLVDGLSLDSTLAKMARFAAYLVQPNGMLAPLGDTSSAPPITADHPILSSHSMTDPVLRFVLTRGAEGEPGLTSAVYLKEGYAIFRDAWRRGPEPDPSLYLLFTAAAHAGRVHKHSDDLSFILFARGRDLLVDAGQHSYEAGDPGREYVVSAPAHNVVLVDGKGFTGFTARLGGHVAGEDFDLVQGSHENYPGIRHRRTLFYSRPAAIFVIDELKPVSPEAPGGAASASHDFEQLFHLASDLSAVVEEGRSTVLAQPKGGSPAAGPILRIAQLGDGRGSALVVEGSKDPFQGWVSRSYRGLEPAPVAIFKAHGRDAVFVTFIEVIEPGRERAADASPDPSCLWEAGGESILLRWPSRIGSREATIQMRNGLKVRR